MRTLHPEAPRTKKAKQEKSWFKKALVVLGPGLVTGAADDDPSGIVTYSSVGAVFAYSTLWLALVTFPLMTCVQYICSKIGLVTGRGLAGVIKEHYPRWLLWAAIAILVTANTANAGADIGAIAAAIHLLAPQLSVNVLIFPIALLIIAIMIIGCYATIARILKWLTLSLVAYIATAFFCKPDLSIALKDTFIPVINFSPGYVAAIVGILGTTISPYLFFWQSTNEVDEQRADGVERLEDRQGASRDDLRYAAGDVAAGMFCSNLVMYFIILSTAATLHKEGVQHIETASQAAQALKPVAGPFAEVLFALGLLGTGLLATPILIASSAYAVADAMGWRHGLQEEWKQAKPFYAFIVISTLIGSTVSYLNVSPMIVLYWVAILNGILAPPLLVIIMLISSSRDIMGEHKNSPLVNLLGWFTTVAMFIAVTLLFWSQQS